MIYRRLKKFKRKLIFLLIIILALCLWLRHVKEEESLFSSVEPVGSREGISACTVTVSLTGKEGETALRLFTSVCEGTGITPCVFVTTKWLEENRDLLPLLSGATLGLLYEESPKRLTQKRTMAAMAEENRLFMTYTGTFPRYVRLAEEERGTAVASALEAYAQIPIGFCATLGDSPLPGAVVDCGFIDGTAGYRLANFYGETLSASCPVVSMESFLNEWEA